MLTSFESNIYIFMCGSDSCDMLNILVKFWIRNLCPVFHEVRLSYRVLSKGFCSHK